MKRRLAVGGVLVAAVAILVGTLTDFFGGWGNNGDARVSVDSSETATNARQDARSDRSTATSTAAVSPEVLEIVVDDQHYDVRLGTGDEAPLETMELDAIVELARKTRGDSDGIRVRIASRPSARYTAEARLHEALIAAGLSEESLQRQKELVP